LFWKVTQFELTDLHILPGHHLRLLLVSAGLLLASPPSAIAAARLGLLASSAIAANLEFTPVLGQVEAEIQKRTNQGI
jgi:hypothetical protein